MIEPKLPLPPYLTSIRDYLRRDERDVWDWFASNRVRAEHDDAVRLDLLKRTYRLDRASDAEIYGAAEEAAAALDVDVPITLYQAQSGEGLNASLAFLPNEAHVILQGAVRAKLAREELKALFAHELSHLALLGANDGDFLIASQVLAALTADQAAEPAHFASERLLHLYSEIYCDRGSLQAVADWQVVVRMLVKIATGLDQVDAAAYLRQADEIFARGPVITDGISHPEAFVRARALRLWQEQGPDSEPSVREMLEGRPVLDELDLLGRVDAERRTRRLIDAMLAPSWMRTDNALAHARLYFSDYAPAVSGGDDESAEAYVADPGFRDAFSYVLLDFVTVDRSLEEGPLAAALDVAERWGFKDRFAELARKELRLRKKQLDDLDREKGARLAKLAAEEATT